MNKIRIKRKKPSSMTNKEFTTMLRYKGQKSDRKLLTKKVEMLSLYHLWYTEGQPIHRPSPTCSPAVSDAELYNEPNDDKYEIVVPFVNV